MRCRCVGIVKTVCRLRALQVLPGSLSDNTVPRLGTCPHPWRRWRLRPSATSPRSSNRRSSRRATSPARSMIREEPARSTEIKHEAKHSVTTPRAAHMTPRQAQGTRVQEAVCVLGRHVGKPLGKPVGKPLGKHLGKPWANPGQTPPLYGQTPLLRPVPGAENVGLCGRNRSL